MYSQVGAMADRALRPESPERGVVDLENDDRWQARLEEARARRAIALREKANSEHAPKRRKKPWEEDGDDEDFPIYEPIDPAFQEEDDDRLDFSDRVKSLRKTSERPEERTAPVSGSNGGPVLDEEVFPFPSAPSGPFEVKTVPVDEDLSEPPVRDEFEARRKSVADRYIQALSPDFTPVRPYVPVVHEPVRYQPARAPETPSADETEKLAREYGSTMVADAVTEVAAPPEAAVEPRRARRKGMPLLLLAGVCVMALVPFTKTVPPLEKGPISEVRMPIFGLEPALGITRPMNALPRETASGEWVPTVVTPPGGPLSLPLERAASFTHRIDPLVPVSVGEESFGELGWWPLASPIDGTTAPVLADLSADRLPGVTEPPSVTAAADAAPAYPEPLSLLRVTILVPRTTNDAVADEIAEDLSLRGHDLAAIEPVDLKISQRNIRYFHDEDRGEAARLAEAYGARLRDFTSFRPTPEEGTLEIWLAGDALPRQPVARRAPVVEQAPPPQPRVIIIQRQPTFLDRITDVLGGGHVETGPSNPLDDSGSTVPAPTTTASTTAPATGTGGTTTGGTGTTTGGTTGSTTTGGTTTGGTGTTTGGTGTTTGGTGTATGGTGTTTGGTGTTTGGTTTGGGTGGTTTGGTGSTTGG